MAKRVDQDAQKIKVRVGGAEVVSRTKPAMDMVSEKVARTAGSTVTDPSQKTRAKESFFTWFMGKNQTKSAPKASVPRPPEKRDASTPAGETPRAAWCDRGINICLHLALILIPLLFTPLTLEAFELTKQTALYILAVVIFLLWLVKIIIAKQVWLVRTKLTTLILVFLAAYLVSSLLSLDRFSSFFGFYGRFNGGFAEAASLVIIFLVGLHNVRSLEKITAYLRTFVVTYLIIETTSLLQVLGAYLWPWNFTKTGSFGLTGSSITLLSVFVAAGLGILVPLMLKEKNAWKWASLVAAVLGIILLFLLDVSVGWITLIAAMVMIFAVVVMRMQQFKGKGLAWVPLIFLAMGVAFLLIPTQGIFNLNLPTELSLGRPVSWDITKAALDKHPLFGSGPETFFQDFNQYRPVQFNDTILWSMRFDKSGTQFFHILSTLGIVGTALWLAIVVAVVIEALRRVVQEKDEMKWLAILGPFSAWLGLTVVSFFYFFNTTLTFLWWVTMALTLAAALGLRSDADKRERRWSFATSPQVALITSFIFLLVLIGGIVSFYYVGKMYLADVHYRAGTEKLAPGGDLPGSLNEMVAAASLNKNRSAYHRGAAQVFMSLANQEAVKENPDVNVVSNNVKLSIDAARTAQSIEPQNVVDWEFLASIYQNAGFYVKGADDWVIDSYNKAIELDPNSPVPYVSLGKAYVYKSDRILIEAAQQLKKQIADISLASEELPAEAKTAADNSLQMAINQFHKAIELKQNYFDAHLSLAQTYDKKLDRESALKEMQVALLLAPQNIDAIYEMGRILYNDKQYDEADAQFRKVLEMNDQYSNALYSLGLIYLQRNEKDKALEMFRKVLELNPGNSAVQDKIDELEGKKTPPAEESIPSTEQPATSGRSVPTGTELEQPSTPAPAPRATPTPTPSRANTTP